MNLIIKKFILISVIIGSVFSFGFCGKGVGKNKQGSFANGVKLWADTCQRCHNLRDPKDFNDNDWFASVQHMRIKSGLTGQDTRDILTFLKASNGD